MSAPLEGIVVVSLEAAISAPFATRQMADLGATVIKVERPEGDFARRYDATVHGQASYFVWLNRGKESLALDLKILIATVLTGGGRRAVPLSWMISDDDHHGGVREEAIGATPAAELPASGERQA